MSQTPGRNDPCPCGSGKKFKQCCGNQPHRSGVPSLKHRKISATVLSAGGAHAEQLKREQQTFRSTLDYPALMERAYGSSLHAFEDAPPVPSSKDAYLLDTQTTENT